MRTVTVAVALSAEAVLSLCAVTISCRGPQLRLGIVLLNSGCLNGEAVHILDLLSQHRFHLRILPRVSVPAQLLALHQLVLLHKTDPLKIVGGDIYFIHRPAAT